MPTGIGPLLRLVYLSHVPLFHLQDTAVHQCPWLTYGSATGPIYRPEREGTPVLLHLIYCVDHILSMCVC